MNAAPENSTPPVVRPPQLIQSLTVGFNALANNVYLLLLPVALDLLLWFGPHMRIKELAQPGVVELLGMMRSSQPAEVLPMINNMEQVWTVFLDRFNLLSLLSTFPVGVPALMVAQYPMQTPLGDPRVVEVGSFWGFLLFWLVLTLVGFALGTLYFSGLAQTCARQMRQAQIDTDCDALLPGQPEMAPQMSAEAPVPALNQRSNRLPPFRLSTLAWQYMQMIALMILLMIILMVLLVPTLILATFLALISPMVAQVALLLASFSAIWFLVPLIFSPHGVFMCGQSVLHAMLNSARLVRQSMPGTGLFLLVAVVLNQGMSVLWRTPPETSWMALVGVFGHAVITTGLLASSFVYYRGGLNYLQFIRRLSIRSI